MKQLLLIISASLLLLEGVYAQVANFSYAGNNGKCPSQTWTFTNSSTGATSYYWDFGDGSVSTQTNPAHTYSYGGNFVVTLTATSGTSSNTRAVAVHVRDFPSASFNISNFGQVRINQGVNFINYSSNAYRYHWSFGDGATSAGRHVHHSYTSGGNKVVTLTAYNDCGDSTVSTQNITVTDTANALPLASGSVSSSVACPGTIISFYNYSTNTTKAKWIFDNGYEIVATGNETKYQFSVKGNYKIKLVAYNGNNTDSAFFDVLVTDTAMSPYAAGGASISPVRMYNSEYGYFNCPGKPFHLTGTYYTGIIKHSWRMNSTVINAKDTNVTITTPGDYPLWYIIENVCGAKDSALFVLKVRDNNTFTNFPVNIDVLPGTATICPGGKVKLSAGYVVTDSNQLRWILHDNSLINHKLQIEQTYPLSGSYTVKLITTPECGIDDTTAISITVNNSAIPPADFYVSGMMENRQNCVGDSLNVFPDYNSSEEYALNPVTHKWYMGDGNIYINKEVGHKYATTGFYTILHETMNGCGGVSYKTATVFADQNITPGPQFYGNPEAICEGDSVMFDNFTADADSFVYHFGDGMIKADKSHFPHVFHAYSNGGTYAAKLYAYNGCGVDSAIWTVMVYSKPHGQILMNDTIVAPNTPLTINRNPLGAVSHLWQLGAGTADTSTANVFSKTFGAPGIYKIYLYSYNQNGCYAVDSVTIEVKINISLDETGGKSFVTVYPNPVNDRLNVQMELNTGARVKLVLMDLNGKQLAVLSENRLPAGKHEVFATLPVLASGLYVLQIQMNEHSIFQKIIKQ